MGQLITIPGYSRIVNIAEKIDGAPHFTWAEVTHGGFRKWQDKALTWNAVHHARKLEELRVKVGKPFTITSWFRTPEMNARIGGAPNSLHTTNQATDVIIPGWDSTKLNAQKLRMMGWKGGIGYYPDGGWFHLSSHPVREHGIFKGQ